MPYDTFDDNIRVYSVLESFIPHRIKEIRLPPLPILERIYNKSKIKPLYVQKRFDKLSQYDIALCKFAKSKGISYQAFWMLRSRFELLWCNLVREISQVSNRERTFIDSVDFWLRGRINTVWAPS